MVRDHGVEPMEGVHHARTQVDEPDEGSALPLQLRDHRLIEFLDESHLMRDSRPIEGLRGDGAARDPIRVDVGHDTDEGTVTHTLRDLLGDRLHRPIKRTTPP